MSISSVLTSAISGLHVTEKGLDVVAKNIANADTPGYTRKVLNRETLLSGDDALGVRVRSVNRELDVTLQRELWTANAAASGADIINAALKQLDILFGTPGSSSSLDAVFNEFSTSLVELSASPESSSVRQQVVTAAQMLAQELNQASAQVQRLRGEADRAIAGSVEEINEALQQIASLSTRITDQTSGANIPADLLDERDRQIALLSTMLDIEVLDQGGGLVSIFTTSGVSLYDGHAVTLEFDDRGALSADTLYDPDPAKRTVGTVSVYSPLAGNSVDLLAGNLLRSGSIAANVQLRDDILVEAQAQLDEIASALALAFSSREVAGVPVTAGAQAGFDVDLSDLKSGNVLTVTTTVSGNPTTFSFVRVDDASQLPLSNDHTADPNDTVVGIDFSGGFAAAVAAINAALGADVTASDAGGNVIRILDDGAAGLSDVDAAMAVVTETSLAGGDVELPFFIDTSRAPSDYTNSLDGSPQKRGFAGRIGLNSAIAADPSALVVYSTSPATGLGDSTRPLFLADRLNAEVAFTAGAGIGVASSPYRGSVGDYLQRVIDFQAGQKANATRDADSRALMRDAIVARHDETGKVDIDKELADLLVLQNAYAANARVISAVDELLQTILNM